MLSPGEQQALLTQWNPQVEVQPAGPTLHQLFEAQAALHPHALALRCGDDSLTYAALNAQANRLARKLRERGVGPEVRVGIATERAVALVVGVLAILKAGGAYVPLDPQYPAERLSYMIEVDGQGRHDLPGKGFVEQHTHAFFADFQQTPQKLLTRAVEHLQGIALGHARGDALMQLD